MDPTPYAVDSVTKYLAHAYLVISVIHQVVDQSVLLVPIVSKAVLALINVAKILALARVDKMHCVM